MSRAFGVERKKIWSTACQRRSVELHSIEPGARDDILDTQVNDVFGRLLHMYALETFHIIAENPETLRQLQRDLNDLNLVGALALAEKCHPQRPSCFCPHRAKAISLISRGNSARATFMLILQSAGNVKNLL